MSRFATMLAALALIAGCGSSTTENNPPPPPPPTANDITIEAGASLAPAQAFSPNPLSAPLSGSATVAVRWVNRDFSNGGVYGGTTSVAHHIVADDGHSFESPTLDGNGTYSVSLGAGTYPYHCTIHPTMKGTITITP